MTKRPRVLLAHKDAAWVAQAKQRLESLGYVVTDCLELAYAADLVTGTAQYALAAISNELEPDSQMRIMKFLKEGKSGMRLMLLLDNLDSASIHVRGRTGILTHRLSEDVNAFALAVAGLIGPAPRPPTI